MGRAKLSNLSEETHLFRGFRIRLHPTDEQIQMINSHFGVHRFCYNWAVQQFITQEALYNSNQAQTRSITIISMMKRLDDLRTTEQYSWLHDYNLLTERYAVRDVCANMEISFTNKRPYHQTYQFSRKRSESKMFYVRESNFHIHDNYVRVQSPIGEIRCDKHKYPTDILGNRAGKGVRHRYSNVRITYSYGEYWISGLLVTIKPEIRKHRPVSTHVVGIDIGVMKNNWIVDSDYNMVSKPDTMRVDEKIGLLTTRYISKIRANDEKFNKRNRSENQAVERKRTKREVKLRRKLRKAYQHRANMFNDRILQYASKLEKSNPDAIVIENLSARDMMDSLDFDNPRPFHSHMMDTRANRIKKILTNTSYKTGIPLIIASPYYPSTQLCSCCGNRLTGQDKLTLKDRTYRCEVCGSEIERDLNSTFNLKYLGMDYLGDPDFPTTHNEFRQSYEVING